GLLGAAITALMCSGCATHGYQFPGISGQVVDDATNTPLANAEITIELHTDPNVALRTRSDASGRFSIQRAGEFGFGLLSASHLWTDARVKASAAGYASAEIAALDLAGTPPPSMVLRLAQQ